MTLGDWLNVKTYIKLGKKNNLKGNLLHCSKLLEQIFFFTDSSYLNTGGKDCFLKLLEFSCIDFLDATVYLGFSIFNKSVWKQTVALLDFLYWKMFPDFLVKEKRGTVFWKKNKANMTLESKLPRAFVKTHGFVWCQKKYQ